jgi:hypothetical protein
MTTDATARTRIEELTHQAFAAAQEGRWDVVDRCYRERESELGAASLSMEDGERLLALDRQVHELGSVARTVLASVLRDAAVHRQRLKELRRHLGASVADSGTIRLHA